MKLSELLSNITRYTSDAVIITQAPESARLANGEFPTIMFVNDAFSALMGYRGEEVMGASLRLLFEEVMAEDLLPRLQYALQHSQRLHTETEVRTKAGQARWVDITCTTVSDIDGVPHFLVLTARDISDAKTMQHATEQQSMAFLQSETRQRAILNSIADGVITLSEDGRILGMSSVAERLFGIESSEAEGKLLTELFAADYAQELEAIITAKMFAVHDMGRLSTHELPAKHLSGEHFYARITCSTLRFGDQKTMVIAARDVSQEKEALDALRIARDAAERASRAKSEFLANMSHELRTPMNGILGLADLLRDAPLQGEHREFLDALNGSASSLLTILNDILDFSKIEAGEMALESRHFSLRQMLQHITDLLSPIAQRKQLDLRLQVPDDLHDVYWGDSYRLQQVLVNLIGNAIKFTPSGSVELLVEEVFSIENGQPELAFHVRDTGIGIAAEYLPHLFDKFSQADSSNTRKFGGTGLGLAICKQLVALMQGVIGVESRAGHGTHFYVILPLTKAQALQSIPHDASPLLPAERAAQARVLIVEDHPVNSLLLKKLLKKMGFEHIEVAEHGQQAVELVQNASFDLIFMDCQMPILDGYDATRSIRTLEIQQQRPSAPIIAMTANAMIGDQDRCMDAGMDAYVSKPIDRARVEHAILQCWHLQQEEVAASSPATLALCESDAPIDLAHLSLFTDGDAEEEKALFEIFLSNAQTTLQQLRESAQTHNRESWRKAAHLLKGASGNLGARALFHNCKVTEEKVSMNEEPCWEEELASIEQALGDVEHFIHSRAA